MSISHIYPCILKSMIGKFQLTVAFIFQGGYKKEFFLVFIEHLALNIHITLQRKLYQGKIVATNTKTLWLLKKVPAFIGG